MKNVRILSICIITAIIIAACACPLWASDFVETKSSDYTLVKREIKDSYPEDFNLYCCDKNGKKLKNSWFKTKISGKTRIFYFGSDGRAYKAKAPAQSFKYNVAVKKVDGVEPLYGTVLKYKRFEVQYAMLPGDKEIVYMAVGALQDI